MSRYLIKSFFFGLSVLFVCSLAYTDEVGSFTAIEGKVDILKLGEGRATHVIAGDSISTGNIIRTKSLSKAEIKFTDKSILKLAENTRVEIVEYIIDESASRKNAIINVQRGQIRAIISKKKGDANFFVTTPNASGSIKGTDVFVFYQKSATEVLVKEGNFSVINNAFPEQAVDVSEGFISVIPPDQPPHKPRQYLDIEKKQRETQTTILAKQAVAEEGTEINATVIDVRGEVKVRYAGATEWADVKLNDTLAEGDQVETKETGAVEFRLTNGNQIALKPSSTIILSQLSMDPKTGDYKNLFEANFGNIRAKVEKLKGNSKFEIKTPTAVAGVRGTTLYLSILPGLTRVFFEGGDGTFTSLISQISKVVGDGQTSSADEEGNVSDSTDATDEEKSGWTGGWDTGEAEPYTEPEGGEGRTGTRDEGAEDERLGIYIPPDLVSSTTPTFTGLTGTLTGEGGSLGKNIAATITNEGTLLSTPTYDPEDLPTAAISGTFVPNEETIWLTDIEGTDTSGGAFLGWIGGTWLSWEGLLASLYIDSFGKIGVVTGDFSGTDDDVAGTFSGDGELYFQPVPSVATGVLPAYLADYVTSSGPSWGSLWSIIGDSEGPTGYISSDFERETKNITGESWGIYKDVYNASYSNDNDLTTFTGVALGHNPDALFLSLILRGEDNLAGTVEMDVLGTYLDYDDQGVYVGSLLGTYTEGMSYDLEAVGLGLFEEGSPDVPLEFIGFWGEDINTLNGNGGVEVASSLYYNDSGNISWAGEECGLIGGETSPWSGEADLSAMGYYYAWESEPYIWNTHLYSYNPQRDNYTTRDGGAFYGVTAGIWNNGEMDGSAVALYLDPDGNAGYLRGDIFGNYDSSIWAAGGILSPTFVETVNPELLDEGPYEDVYLESNLLISGNFNDAGRIEGYIELERTYSLYEDSNWGIYDFKFGDGNSYENPDPEANTNWSGVMGSIEDTEWNIFYLLADLSNGTWEDGEIRADVSGAYLEIGFDDGKSFLGRLDGDFYGANNGYDGTWIGTSIGAWEDDPLTFASNPSSSLYYSEGYNEGGYDYTWLSYDGWLNGILGGTTSLWDDNDNDVISGGDNATFIGSVYTDSYNPSHIWATEVYSYDYHDDAYTTYDDGAYYGFIGGIHQNPMEGRMVALYIDPPDIDGISRAGILSGGFSGTSYPEIEMFQMDGTLVKEEKTSDIGIDPADLYNSYYYWGYLSGSVTGHFTDGGSLSGDDDSYYSTLSIVNYDTGETQPWGIFDLTATTGTYEEPTGTWMAVIGGDGEFGAYYNDTYGYFGSDYGYWLADIDDGIWDATGKITGSIDGDFITYTKTGTINGELLGAYNDNGTWQAVSLGDWEGDPLTFSGEWGGGYWDEWEYYWDSLYYNDWGYPQYAGSEWGIIGSTTPFWWNEDSFYFLAMGEYGTWESEPYIWNTEIYSYNELDGGAYTTIDGGAFLGSTGGIWNNGIMNGSAVALYVDPYGNVGLLTSNDVVGDYYPFYDGWGEEGMWMVTGDFTPTQMASNMDIDPEYFEEYIDNGYLWADLNGGFSDEGEGYIEGWNYWGGTTFIYTYDWEVDISQPWGIYDLKLGGEDSFYNPGNSTIWFASIGGWGEFGYTDGGWLGGVGGIWKDGEIQGVLRALYITEENSAGLIKGDVFGLYDEIEENYGTWIGESIGIFTEMGPTDVSLGDIGDFEDLEDFISYNEFSGTGFGNFEGGGTLEDVSIEGAAFNISDQKWGIWVADYDGIYEGSTSPFTLAVGGYSDYDRCWLGTVGGGWESGVLSGAFKGILMYEGEGGVEGGIAAASMTGDVIGTYIDVDDGTDTWQAAGIGEWVEVTELLTPENLGFTMDQLEQFLVEVPITEVYTNLLTGSQGFITAAAMDISLYNDWLWTALIYGTYNGAPDNPADWTVSLGEGTDSVTLNGTMWDDTANEWLADVAGAVDGNNITGEAGGIFGDGEFEGVGAGTVVEN